MRALLQRILTADVTVDGKMIGRAEGGFLILLGVTHDDTIGEAEFLASKIVNLRVFEDDAGAMNLSALDRLAANQPAGMLVVSQFTLYADAKKGRRPSFVRAARPETAAPLVDQFVWILRGYGLAVETGQFGAHMDVTLTNSGPVTIWLDTAELRG